METTTVSESVIDGVHVSFYCVSGTPVGEVYIVACAGENKFFEGKDEARSVYIKKARALLA